MRRFIAILESSFRIALQELWKNKLRTFLSLFGITIGIFCIIGVLTTVGSLEKNLQREIRSLGTNTIYVDKWQYAAGPDYPYWKYVKRPLPQYSELALIKDRTPSALFAAFKINGSGSVEAGNAVTGNVRLYGVSEDFSRIQSLEIQYGRYLNEDEFYHGVSNIVIGYDLAQTLFENPEMAPGKLVAVRGRQNRIVGVMKKQGAQLLGGWGFDQSVIFPYKYARTILDERRSDPLIMVQGKKGINSKQLQDDLRGSLRAIRKLRPAEEENFSLNDVADFSETMSRVFVNINLGGWIIGALAFIVGIFGVANIMFVTVNERTSQIGLKKALGAKRSTILAEFLGESAFLCIVGGVVGLLLIFILTKVATAVLEFPIFLSPGLIGIAIFICIMAGILAGIIPAIRAARMNPVEAIRR